MKIEKTTTGVIIREPSPDVKKKCLQYFSLTNPLREFFIYSGNDPDHKPFLGHEHDVIYITSGYFISLGVKNLYDRKHPGATYTNKMNSSAFIQ